MALRIKDELSVAEVVTATTASAIGLSTIYNWGFFSAVDGSLITLLSVQDLLIGAAISILPATIAISIGMYGPRLWPYSSPGLKAVGVESWIDIFQRANREPLKDRKISASARLAILGVSCLLLAVSPLLNMLWPTVLPAAQYLPFAFGGVGIVVLLIANGSSGRLAAFFGMMFLLSSAFFIGRGEYFKAALEPTGRESIIMTENSATKLSARIIRNTSNYVFAYKDNVLSVIPRDSISSIEYQGGTKSVLLEEFEKAMKANTPPESAPSTIVEAPNG